MSFDQQSTSVRRSNGTTWRHTEWTAGYMSRTADDWREWLDSLPAGSEISVEARDEYGDPMAYLLVRSPGTVADMAEAEASAERERAARIERLRRDAQELGVPLADEAHA